MAKKKEKSERLRALIDEATVDCYTEDEEQVGFMTMVADKVVCPFPAKVIGEEVEVVKLHQAEAGFGVEAVCRSADLSPPGDDRDRDLALFVKKTTGFVRALAGEAERQQSKRSQPHDNTRSEASEGRSSFTDELD